MKNLTREQINRALDELKALRKESRYSGRLEYHNAMCYSTSFMTTVYDWEKLPHRHVCHTCNKTFGVDRPQLIMCGRFLGKAEGPDLPEVFVESWTYDRLYELYSRLFGLGCDVVLEINCADCISEKHAYPMIFKFRASPELDYTVSYPKVMYGVADHAKSERDGETVHLFEPYEYDTAVSFIEKVWPSVGGWLFQDACRRWLEEFRNGFTYEGRPWSDIFYALKGILGIDLGE